MRKPSKRDKNRQDIEDEIVEDEVTFELVSAKSFLYDAVVGEVLMSVITDIEFGLYRQKDVDFVRLLKKIEDQYNAVAQELSR